MLYNYLYRWIVIFFLNNWFLNNAILHLEINWSLTKYENTIIKHIIDILIKQEKKPFIAVFINCILMSINAL